MHLGRGKSPLVGGTAACPWDTWLRPEHRIQERRQAGAGHGAGCLHGECGGRWHRGNGTGEMTGARRVGTSQAWLRPKGILRRPLRGGRGGHALTPGPGQVSAGGGGGRMGREETSQPGGESSLRVRPARPGRARGWAGRVPVERPCPPARPALLETRGKSEGPPSGGVRLAPGLPRHCPPGPQGVGEGEPPRGPRPGSARPGGSCRFRRAAPSGAAPGGSPGGWGGGAAAGAPPGAAEEGVRW